ncbi:glycyl-radical enzyme activating protein [Desulfomicrobium sp. ZS1]|jgi:pyruvate formate lyase activating enzyme|uniref:(2S)-3-sulfopropanediol dehydratase activating enzyme n=1 Tax=Desulfomicrobium sp. ZS1 TaxID=2952228 RepID=UPI0020B2C907|nr:glycyl-radical enzyme activating protein [Desulfomicrobium sp. ZS1]UTF51426.1 glycyl-radical enzyme activating protein [Desulfomicrobium sp. ZS1]
MSALEDKKKKGLVFNIQKYSVHDGPGIRTIVFLKGCPLSCRWCSNPESQRREPELAFNAGRCLTFAKCTRCLQACLRGAVLREADDSLRIDRSLCTGCPMNCAEACPSQGLIVYGQERSVDDVLKVVEQDAAFYTRSSGGLTLSGGEPLLQDEFALALLRDARRRRIKTAVETCGMVPWKTLEAAAPYLNYVLYDIKHMDSGVHKEQTGCSNATILDNFQKLAALDPDKPILARTPIIPGFNDSEAAINAIAEFIKPFPNVRYEMLPYHRLGTQKYHFLDRVPPMNDVTLDKSIMSSLRDIAKNVLGDRVEVVK